MRLHNELRSLGGTLTKARLRRFSRALVALPFLLLVACAADLPQKTREALSRRSKAVRDLDGKKALIVDDDIRNIFALASALEQHGMNVLTAESGKDGIELLKNNSDVDVVLIDIMMPELDGYDTIRIMRQLERFKDLPIIAITAKAMQGDREKCIEAGATDYLAKPVNTEQLMSLLRVWLTTGRTAAQVPGC